MSNWQTYWNNAGKYQQLADELQAMIPHEGECPSDKPLLEKFRRAVNCYYDLYNNGLCNRAGEFRGVFGFIAGHRYGGRVTAELAPRTESAMNRIVLQAASENLTEVSL